MREEDRLRGTLKGETREKDEGPREKGERRKNAGVEEGKRRDEQGGRGKLMGRESQRDKMEESGEEGEEELGEKRKRRQRPNTETSQKKDSANQGEMRIEKGER